MTHRVGPKGQVVIPKELRELLGLRPGSQVVFDRDGDAVLVRKVTSAHDLIGTCAVEGASLTRDLEEERAREREREAARDR